MITKKTFKVPLYPFKIEVIIYDDIKEVEKYRPNRKGYSSFCDGFEDGFIRIGIYSKSGGSFIAHECHHAKSYIWEIIGYKPIADNDEVDAYLIAWISKAVTDVFYKHKEKTNEKETKTE